MTPTNPEGVPDPAVAGLIAEGRALLPELVGTLPACPFDRRSPDYWTTSNDKPCHVCGGTEEVDKCRGADLRCLDKADDIIRRLADELERVARQPGREVFVVRGTASPYYDENWVVRAHTTEAAAEADVAFLTAKWAELRPDSVAMKEFDPGFYQYGGDWDVEAVPVVAPPPQPQAEAPIKMLVDADWLRKRVESDPDINCETGPTEGVEFSKREGDETFTLSKEARDDPTLSYIINCAFFGRDGETLFNQLPEGGVRVTLDGYCIHPRDKPCPAQAVGVSVEGEFRDLSLSEDQRAFAKELKRRYGFKWPFCAHMAKDMLAFVQTRALNAGGPG